MVNYNNGKIYKIECLSRIEEDDIYIGSTTKEHLSQRMDTHRMTYKSWLKGKGSHIRAYDLFEKYGLENCRITLIETCPCESRDALVAREGYYQRQMKCVNKNIAGRTIKEWYEDNKDKIKESQKKYQKAVRDKMKEYRAANKDKIKAYLEANKDKIKSTIEIIL